MSNRSDQLIDTLFSEEANDIKNKANTSFMKAILLGVSAFVFFGVCAVTLFTAFVGFIPLSLSVPVCMVSFSLFIASIPACWVFAGRSIYFRAILSQHVNEHMMTNRKPDKPPA
jgi:hypothetical protein